MQIILYNFSKKKNSTKQPASVGITVDCYLKDNTSLEHPIFVLNYATLPDYSYVKAFDRYYFVSDVFSIANNMWEISCELDALATNRNNIGQSTFYVERASSAYTPQLYDTFYPSLCGRKQLVNVGADLFSTSGYFVLGLTGKPEASPKSAVTYYKLSSDELKALLDYFYTDSNFSEVIKDTVTKGFFNPFQYIISCMWVPFTYTTSAGDTRTIQFGWWEDTGLTGHTIDSYITIGVPTSQKIRIPKPYSPSSDYRNSEPYAIYRLYIPIFGMISLSGQQLSNYDQIGYELYIDVATGTGLLRVRGYNDTSSAIITDVTAKVGCDVALAQTGMTLGDFASSAIGGIAGAVIGGGLGTAGAIAGAVSGTASAANSLGMSEETANRNGVRSYVDFDNIPKLICDYYDTPIDGIEVNGRPLGRYVQINTLSGYVKCQNASIDIEGHIDEINEINAYLNGGFYYE